MKSTMKHDFSQVPKATIPRSSFNRSHGKKLTFDSGKLVPFFVDEVLPGDTMNLKTSGFARLATPIYPVMDNMTLTTHYFAVPNRLLWDNWQKMMGEQANPDDSTDYLVPQTTSPPVTGYDELTMADYMGIPTKIPDLAVSALPSRAYFLIWNEWFRDENLQDSVPIDKGDGPDPAWHMNGELYNRGKRFDYFTSCLPFPQKGPDILIPIQQTAPVIPNGFTDGTQYPEMNFGGDSSLLQSGAALSQDFLLATGPTTANQLATWDNSGLVADLTGATAATINQLREAFAVQKMYEKDARGGTRYTEVIQQHFGVSSPDARLQRPEYLGGSTTPINITPLAATAQTNTDVQNDGRDLGALSAVGTASFQGHGFTKSFTEHCTVIGLISVTADLSYQQGLERMWSRQDKLDFYWPSLAQIGEQEVLNKEIYAQGSLDPAADAAAFGYQERYAEYRYKNSQIHGRFRSNSTVPLDAWHLAQNFLSLPLLGTDFIQDQPPIDRVIAVQDEPQFIGDFYHNLIHVRPMPVFGVPGNMDRF